MTDSKKIAFECAKILDSKKAHDVVIIDIRSKATFADYLVVGSASNERLIAALADDVDEGLAKIDVFSNGKEGVKESGWILMDCGDIIVNIFSDEMRSRYNLEKVWGDCELISYQEEGN